MTGRSEVRLFFHKYFFMLIVAQLMSFMLVAGNAFGKNQPPQKREQLVQVKAKTSVSRLFYNGTLGPLTVGVVQSPVDGIVIKLFFSYGQEVKKGQSLFSLSSDKLATDFQSSVQDYLQKKQALAKAKQDADTDSLLYKAGATPRDTLEQSKTTFENAKLQILESTQKLKKILSRSGVDSSEVEGLTIHNTKQVEALLGRKFTHILVKAKAAGVALLSTSDQSQGGGGGDGGSQKQLYPGSSVKKGQTLLSIGDLSGLSTSIKISEINVNRIRVGQPVLVTGDAFPGVTLRGQVSAVAAQATQSGYGSGLSMFAVKVKIPHITAKQAKEIHVGMTSKIEMPIKDKAHISVPIAAVTNKNGQHYVTVVSPAGARSQILVVAGGTTADGQVAILQGLVDGETIVVPLSAPAPAGGKGAKR